MLFDVLTNEFRTLSCFGGTVAGTFGCFGVCGMCNMWTPDVATATLAKEKNERKSFVHSFPSVVVVVALVFFSFLFFFLQISSPVVMRRTRIVNPVNGAENLWTLVSGA